MEKGKNNFKMFVIGHKSVKQVHIKNYCYLQVGTEINGKIDSYMYFDSMGDNISKKNPNYCELTGMYWIWKHAEVIPEFIGLCHYRRFFLKSNIKHDMFLLNEKAVNDIFRKYDVIVPNKLCFHTSVYEEYYKGGVGRKKDLDALIGIIENRHPEYTRTMHEFLESHKGFYCNMFVMRKKDFVRYCEWLFGILFELERVTDLENYTISEARVYGYLSELLSNIWINYNFKTIKNVHVINYEMSLVARVKGMLRQIYRNYKYRN